MRNITRERNAPRPQQKSNFHLESLKTVPAQTFSRSNGEIMVWKRLYETVKPPKILKKVIQHRNFMNYFKLFCNFHHLRKRQGHGTNVLNSVEGNRDLANNPLHSWHSMFQTILRVAAEAVVETYQMSKSIFQSKLIPIPLFKLLKSIFYPNEICTFISISAIPIKILE